jgi:hypothetical protein
MSEGFELFDVPVPWEFWAMLSEERFAELMAGRAFTDEEVALVLRLNGRLH